MSIPKRIVSSVSRSITRSLESLRRSKAMDEEDSDQDVKEADHNKGISATSSLTFRN